MHELFLFALDAAGRFCPKSSNLHPQCAKKVLSDSLGLEDFAIGLVSFVLSLPDGQVIFFENSNYRRTVYSNLLIKKLLGLVKVMFGLVHASYS